MMTTFIPPHSTPISNAPDRSSLRPAAVLALGLLATTLSAGAWAAEPAEVLPNVLVAHVGQAKTTIDKNIYGHFSEHLGRCIYEGYWVGEDSPIPNVRGIRKDVVEALKNLSIPVLRWPGGCFADEYHWKQGIGPMDQRAEMVNTHWGGVTENNHFGTHEFLELCSQLGCEPYVCGNVGSGTVAELSEWVEYMTMDGRSPMADLRRKNGRDAAWNVKYWGVGNENWGCGGNMRPEFYADQYRRYATYVRHYGKNQPFKIACGANGFDYTWTEVLMREAGRQMNGLSLHYYCGTGRKSRSATNFQEEDWFSLLKSSMRMEELIRRHSEIMDRYDREKRVALIVDEWGTWHEVEPGTNPGFLYQQNTLRDALVASITLDIFHQHADRVRMANIAQTVNVLQAMVLTDKEKMLLTPTYHVFEMYKAHQDATLIPTTLGCAKYEFENDAIPSLSASASRAKDGRLHVSVSNLNPKASAPLVCQFQGFTPKKASGRVLTADSITAHNTFDKPTTIQPRALEGISISGNHLKVTLPPMCVAVLEVE